MLDSDAPTGATENTEDNQTVETPPPAPSRRRRAASRPAGPPAPAPEPAPAVGEPPAAGEGDVEGGPEPAAEAAVVAEPAVEEVGSEEPTEEPTEEPVATEPADETAEEPTPDQPVTEASAAPESAPEPTPEPATARRRRRATRAAGQPLPVAEPAPEDRATAPRTTRRGGSRPAELEGRSAASEIEAAPTPAELEAPFADAVGEQLAELAERPARRRVADRVANPFTPADISAALDDLAAAIGAHPAEDEEGEVDEEAGTDAEAFDEDAPRRRRRRRGGRRRRRGADATEGEVLDEGAEQDEAEEAPSEEEGEPTGDAEAPAEVSGRRRRRRRRRGEESSAEAETEDGVDVVVKVREPRKSASPSDQITGIEGSTRMEAKKQRRREGRAAGRRRAPILSEAEFLARRESVERQMLIRQADDYTQIAVLEDGILVEHYVDRDSAASMIGNIYLGRVQNVLPSMEAAFIDIGRGRNAVLYAGEVDWDAYGATGADRKVEKVLKSGQAVLVQVTKDPVGAKGARLTSHISIPGRYVVYAPGGHLSGISRKLPENERTRLKGILDSVVGEDASVIVRTAAEGASEEELVRDVSRLKAQWEVIEKKVKAGQAPQQLYSEPDLTVRIVRDLFTEDFGALIVDGNGRGEDAYDTVQAYVTHVAPHLQERLRHWDRATEGDLFDRFRVHEQVAKALERKVHLPSGGSLIIDRTEAMTVIDVNTGKFTGTQGNLEATVTSNNLEAAEEIVRQLRLRDIGGIIVIDFIDMVLPANRELLLRRLVECLGRDRTRHQVAEVTSLGLVQMTRKKIGTGLHEAFTVPCETCSARGYHVHESPVSSQAPADGGDRDNGAGRRGRAPASRNDQRRQEPRPTPPSAPAPPPEGHAEAPVDPAPVEPSPDAGGPAEA